MSDRLAVSATLSVLMMTIYVLFSTDAARAPLGPMELESRVEVTMPGLYSMAPGTARILHVSK